MSWSAFDEFKTFASKVKEQCKRKKDWNKPVCKKHKSSDKGSIEGEDGIERFSSDDDEGTSAQRPSHAGKYKIEDPLKKRSPRTQNPCKRMRTNADNEMGELIDDSEETPEGNNSTTNDNGSKYHSASDEEKQLLETLDVMIKDFNSSDEEDKTQKSNEFENIDNPTPTPTPSTSDSTPTPTVKQTGVPELSTTGSEWLKKVHSVTCTSTVEDDTSIGVKAEVDSAKKVKQKFKRSGLAEQLQKVINREKSEKTFWTHKQTSSANSMQDTTSALDVQILSLQMQYSLHIARCYILSGSGSDNTADIIDVVFNDETCKQIVPRVGCAIRIHPPWQKLQPSLSPYPILLCTYYCEKLPTPPASPDIDVASLTDISMIPVQSVEESSHLTHSLQKTLKPTKLVFESSTDTTTTKTTNSFSNINRDRQKSSIAQAIETQGGCSGECVSFQAVIQRIYKRRVKVARDRDIGSPGYLSLSKSLITRARSGEDKEEVRWTLLVQDSSLNICEIQIPAELMSQDQWLSCIRHGEGKCYSFTDLVITQRTNRTRSPGLFSLVDSLWYSRVTNHCQDDKSSQITTSQETGSQGSQPISSPASYCYVLTVQEDSYVIPCDQQDESSSPYKSPIPSSLQNLTQHQDTPKRFAVWCRLICSRPSLTRTFLSNPGCQSWTGQLFVTDASLHRGTTQGTQDTNESMSTQGAQDSKAIVHYVKIDVRPSYVMCESIRKAVLEAGGVLYFQDVLWSGIDGHTLNADSYTTIKRGATDPCQADLDTGDVKTMPLDIYTDLVALRTRQFICPLSSSSTCESLCNIEGVVQGVDEESACCWLECPVCACQDLLERNGVPYYCPVCKDDVSNPTTKTNLNVYIKCDTWKEARVKVKLLQSTIEVLLPVSYQDSDQGYDIERVLGKRLGPLYCYIEEHNDLTATLSEITVSL